MSKNLKYFMRESAKTESVVTVPGVETIKDENGNVVPLKIKVLSMESIEKINDAYHTRTIAMDKKGRPYTNAGNVVFKDERDAEKASAHIIVEALVDPNLKDPEIMRFFDCVDVTEMPRKVFSRADEYSYVIRTVMSVLGMGDDISEDEQIAADEEEINDAKN